MLTWILLALAVLVIAGLGFVRWYDRAGQRPDPDFDPRVELPAFTAQVDPLGRKFGMNRTDTDDRQLLLNILHWLSRVDG